MGFGDWFRNHIFDLSAKKGDAAAPAGTPVPDATALKPGDKTIGDIVAGTPKPTFDRPIEKSKGSQGVSFAQIFDAAGIKTPAHGFTVYKVGEMLASDRLTSMTPETKAAAVLVALEAAGAKLEDVIRDAVARDKALDAFEEFQERRLADLRKTKEEENKKLKEEVKTFVNQKRIQFKKNKQAIESLDLEIVSWKDDKRKEEDKLHRVVGHFVAQNPITMSRIVSVISADAAQAEPAAGGGGAT
ncbi:MAG: hypothetical protein RDV41_05640 [Planctomycetota bacterium]|nr:hypothetical protein [Planctomycetota bacterium]